MIGSERTKSVGNPGEPDRDSAPPQLAYHPGVPETRRQHPRYLRFLTTGGLLGLLVAAVLVLVRGELVERPSVLFFYLGVLLAGLGALVGGLVAIGLGSRRRHSAADASDTGESGESP